MEKEAPTNGILIISVNIGDGMKLLLERWAELAQRIVELPELFFGSAEHSLRNSICIIDEFTYYQENISVRTFGYSLVPKYKNQVINRKPLFIRARSNC